MATKIIPFNRDWLIHKGDIVAPITQTGFMKGGQWKMNGASATLDESDWKSICLPHDFVIEGEFCRSRDRFIGQSSDIPAMEDLDSMHTSRGSLSGGVAWYRRHFTLPPEAIGKRVYLQFDGIYRDSTVYVNQYLCCKHLNGYLGFRTDITDVVSDTEDNIIAVRADSSEVEGWWYPGGGIYRNVWLIIEEQVHFSENGIHVVSNTDCHARSAQTTISLTAENHTAQTARTTAHVSILSPTEECVWEDDLPLTIPAMGNAEASISAQLESLSLWDCEHPNLYTVNATLENGAAIGCAVGFRTIRFDKDHGFFLNEKPTKLKGVCVHQGHGGIGVAEFDGMHEYKLRKLRALGANAYRTSHNPVSPALLDACDRMGMLVMDETRLLSTTDEDKNNFIQMIKRDRNHPSVIMWSIGNEEYNQFTEYARKIARTMTELAHALDPTRPTTEAMLFWDKQLKHVREDVEISAPISENVDVLGINYGLVTWDKLHAMYPDKPVVISEIRSAGATRSIVTDDPESCHVSATSKRIISSLNDGETAWKNTAERDYVSGMFLWTGFDYYGEPTPFKFPAVSTQFGVLDLCGFPKYSYPFYRKHWAGEDVFALAPHWNDAPLGETRDVFLFGECDTAELFVNGTSQGIRKYQPYSHFLWENVPFEAGEITAVGYDKDGREIRRTSVKTTGAPVKLAAEIDHVSVDDNKMVYAIVNLAALDAEGRIVHNFGNSLVRFGINTLFHSRVRDIMTGCRAFSYAFVKTFPVLAEGFEIETEMTIHALDKNMHVDHVVIPYRDRPEGSVSKLHTLRDGAKVLRTVMSLHRNYKPHSFFGAIGAVLLLLSAAFFLPVLLTYFQTGLVPNFPTLIVCGFVAVAALLSFFAGLQLQSAVQKNRQDFEWTLIRTHAEFRKLLQEEEKE